MTTQQQWQWPTTDQVCDNVCGVACPLIVNGIARAVTRQHFASGNLAAAQVAASFDARKEGIQICETACGFTCHKIAAAIDQRVALGAPAYGSSYY